MVNGNGYLPRKTVVFRIGDEEIQVRALGFLDLDENETVRAALDALSPDIPSREYLRHVMTIVANQTVALEPGWSQEQLVQVRAARAEEYMQALLAGEGSEVIESMGKLLRVSGFRLPEPATVPATENPGTGTSISSLPDSPSETSAEVIPS